MDFYSYIVFYFLFLVNVGRRLTFDFVTNYTTFLTVMFLINMNILLFSFLFLSLSLSLVMRPNLWSFKLLPPTFPNTSTYILETYSPNPLRLVSLQPLHFKTLPLAHILETHSPRFTLHSVLSHICICTFI